MTSKNWQNPRKLWSKTQYLLLQLKRSVGKKKKDKKNPLVFKEYIISNISYNFLISFLMQLNICTMIYACLAM